MELPPDLTPRSPTRTTDAGVEDDGAPGTEVDLEPRPPVITADPLATRLIPGELAILSVVAAIVLVAGWVVLEFAGMVTAPADPRPATPVVSPPPSLVAGSDAPTAAPSASASPRATASPSPMPLPSFGTIALAATDQLTGRWRRIAAPSIGGRSHAAVAWNGDEVLVWGGFNGEARWGDGGAYNVATDRWRRLPKSPLSARMAPAAGWTGREFLVWGGYRVRFAMDGAAFDPAANAWRSLPEAPLAPGLPAGAWTGSSFVVVTGAPSAATYDPVADRWQPLPDPPVAEGSLEVVVAAERVFVVRRAVDPGQPISIVELLPEATWRALPDGPIAGDGAARPALVAGSTVVVGDAVYDTADGTWSVLAAGPCGFTTEIAAVAGPLVLSPAAAVDLAAGTCRALPRIPDRPGGGTRVASINVWTGTDWIVWSGGNGDPGVVFPNDGVAFRPADG